MNKTKKQTRYSYSPFFPTLSLTIQSDICKEGVYLAACSTGWQPRREIIGSYRNSECWLFVDNVDTHTHIYNVYTIYLHEPFVLSNFTLFFYRLVNAQSIFKRRQFQKWRGNFKLGQKVHGNLVGQLNKKKKSAWQKPKLCRDFLGSWVEKKKRVKMCK